jgi:hypothetical protein
MTKRNSVIKNILIECSEDDVGLWSIIREVKSGFQDLDDETLRKVTLELLSELLEAELIQAGYPSLEEKSFNVCSLSPKELIVKIEKEWLKLGREPRLGDIVWFVTTDKGDKKAEELKKKS